MRTAQYIKYCTWSNKQKTVCVVPSSLFCNCCVCLFVWRSQIRAREMHSTFARARSRRIACVSQAYVAVVGSHLPHGSRVCVYKWARCAVCNTFSHVNAYMNTYVRLFLRNHIPTDLPQTVGRMNKVSVVFVYVL